MIWCDDTVRAEQTISLNAPSLDEKKEWINVLKKTVRNAKQQRASLRQAQSTITISTDTT